MISTGQTKNSIITADSAGTTHATRGARNGWIFFLRGVFLSGLDYGLVSLRWVGNGLVRLFSIPVYSPRDKRGKRGSRNLWLGFAIGADYGRFLSCDGVCYWTRISTPTVLLIRSANRSTWDLPPRLVGIDTTSGSSISFFPCPTLSLIQSKT